MTVPSFQRTQMQFAGHLRAPDRIAPPAGIEARRLAIYRDLIYNNIEGFLLNGFPVLRSILDDKRWHSLVSGFIADHRCQTPYFLEIGQEFLRYLQEIRQPEGWEPPYLLELCHYEWVELVLDTATDELPGSRPTPEDPLATIYDVSPLVWRLSYQFPVHKISEHFQPQVPVAGGVHLLVYRNSGDEVGFLEINQVVARLIQLIENQQVKLGQLLLQLAEEIHYPDIAALESFAIPTLHQLTALSILFPRPDANR